MTRSEFNDLILKISRKMYGYSYHMLKNQEEAEDAVQEVFIRLWKMNAKLDHYKSPEALAMKMTRNHCIDLLRKTKRISDKNLEITKSYHSDEPSPHEQIENRESYNLIMSVLDKMPENYRELICLRDIEGFSYEEMTVITDQNINALRVILSRARKLLREEYQKYFNEYTGNK